MATIDGVTAQKMLEIWNSSIVTGIVSAGHLQLQTRGGTSVDAGAIAVTGPSVDGDIVVNAVVTGSGLTITSAQAGILVRCDKPADFFTVHIDAAAAPVGTVIGLKQEGQGRITFTWGAGVTIDFTAGAIDVYSRSKNSVLILYHQEANHWLVFGDFTEVSEP